MSSFTTACSNNGVNSRNVSSLTELLRWRAADQPERVAYRFLVDGEAEVVSVTYKQLDQQATAVAVQLQALDLAGERAVLLYPAGLEFISAFFGCLYAGVIAVPAYPPDPARLSRSLPRLGAIVSDAQPLAVLTTSPILSMIEQLTARDSKLQAMHLLASDNISADTTGQWRDPKVTGNTPAFLQYTSGSTASPKGVVVTHGNLLHNELMIQQVCEHTEQSTFVGWLPLYHDMGLIGNVLQPLFIGAPGILMSPVSFLQRPFRWLQAISSYNAATSGGPNFAYDLCVRKITEADRASLDLSSWTTAFNGAEPIRPETLERFAKTFEPCGFRRETFFPCYGLAEGTLIVSGGRKNVAPVVRSFEARSFERDRIIPASVGDAGCKTLAGCGQALPGQEIIIVDPVTMTCCAPDHIGEIWVAGPSVTCGYWGRAKETEDTFRAHVADTGKGPFLRTGDMGFFADGELFITGRIKDLIIIRGRNHYPQDIELTVERSHPALRLGCCAAFAIEDAGEERLVVVQEADPKHSKLETAVETIRQTISENHDVQAHAVVLIKPGSIPKTSSGKIQRHACRAAFLNGQLDALEQWRVSIETDHEKSSFIPGTAHGLEAIKSRLKSQLASKLGLEPHEVKEDQPVTRYALDSLAAIELAYSVEADFGVNLPMVSFLQGLTINELAHSILTEHSKAAATQRAVASLAREEAGEYPLSFGQRAIWFLHQLTPESAAYNLASAVRIRSSLDVPSWKRALTELIQRHASLRATFTAFQGQPVQRIHDQTEACFLTEEASSWSDSHLDEVLSVEANRPFDLARGPLLRVQLFSRSAEDHIMLIVVHHIVADFWSLVVLMHEMGVLYSAQRNLTHPSLGNLPMRYVDYVDWHNQVLSGDEGDRLWAYWQEQLAGDLPILNLPADRPRPIVQTYRGASTQLKLNAELTQALKALARSHDATLYTVLLSAFYVLLHRYSSQEDILVGSATSGRNRAELAGLVGYFVNPLVLRADLSGNPGFSSFLNQVRGTVLDAFAHSEYPFPLLVERLQPERSPDRSPLFQVMFVFQKAHILDDQGLSPFALGEAGAHMNLGGLEMESRALKQRVAQFDLTVMIAETEGQLAASFQYNADLYEEATIQRMADHFHNLLDSIVCDPARTISLLNLLSDREQLQLEGEWINNHNIRPTYAGLHQFFQQQAISQPHATAVVCGHERFTYLDLETRANHLARFLTRLGARPESLVAVCLNRSFHMVVALLGILKSGAAYVPLDPAYPQHRIDFMLQDSGSTLVITELALLDRLANFPDAVICIDRDWPDISLELALPLHNPALAENLAYVIYTSGSTGLPKGVAIRHHSAAVLIEWARLLYTDLDLSGVLAATSICFDLSVFELFAPLSWGGTVILAPNALEFPLLLAAQEVSLINTVPSAMAELVRRRAITPSVKTVNLAGEPLLSSLVKQIYDLPNVEIVYNLYGPSEDTTYSTCSAVSPDALVTIGRPLSNSRLYIVGRNDELLPLGVPGDICIAGDGLARGYLNRPDLTAQRFVPDPFSTTPGQRMYRTGDLGRRRIDGDIEFLGRVDNQIKLRGYRIELGEIEAALCDHQAVQLAVVILREREPGDQRLLAYVVLNATPSAGVEEIKAYLKHRLPEFMVPSHIVTLDRLPLLPNGKIDRQRLPDVAPLPELPQTERATNETEQVVAGIWAAVLGVNAVGLRQNFFDLGGHSLLATQVIARIQEAFGVDLPLRRLFEAPTVSQLANVIELMLKDGRVSKMPPLKPIERNGSLKPSFAQYRLWFLEQLEPGSAAYNIPGGLRLKGDLDVAALERGLNEIVRRHESLRTVFAASQGRPMQVVHEHFSSSLEILDLQHLIEGEREAAMHRIALGEARRPFDLSAGPLFCARLLRLSEEDHVLLVAMHHIISDGWSLGVFLRELVTLYESFSAGDPSPLPDLPIQYADYAQWQQNWLQEGLLESQLSYWKEQLGDGPPVLELPVDRPRSRVQTFRGLSYSFALPEALSSSFKALSHREGATLFMSLLSVFDVLLHRYTGQPDISVGTPVANRRHVEIEELIGFFANTLVMRVDLSGNPSFRELLARVREATLEAHANQDLPFEKLVEQLQPERSLSHTPLFQVMFVLNQGSTEERELPGLTISPFEIDTGTAKFDLMMTAEDTGERIRCAFQYNADLYEEATIQRMADHFHNLLDSIVCDPARTISLLNLLSDREQLQLEGEWINNHNIRPTYAGLHHYFQQQAISQPHATAVVCGPERFTYLDLETRANHLARFLTKLGARPESLVAVCLNRSFHMVVALLGILKSGAAYVPLDPAYPQHRIDFMLQDSGSTLVITELALLDRLANFPDAAICIDRDWHDIVLEPALPLHNTALADSALAESLAYVIYTSGSTGLPKGVAIRHHSAAVLIEWARLLYTDHDLSGVLAATSICFDLSVFELFAPLSWGGTVILASNALEFPLLLAAQEVSLINTVPSAMAELVRRRAITPSVKTVNLAGEPLLSSLVKQIHDLPHVRMVYNLYGPSEDTTYSTCSAVSPDAHVTIGRPLSNSRLYIVGHNDELLPLGVPGDICIAGDGLARGYLNRPDLTAQRFVPDPFSTTPGQRMYRTGDLGRRRIDGDIEFLGRVDNQIKLRGYRIELGEIEAALCDHQAVQLAVVILREREPGDQRLFAYVVLDGTPSAGIEELKTYLKHRLPEFMVPSHIVTLDQLPLLPNGKIDRHRLPDVTPLPELHQTERATNETEQVVAGIWAAVLGVNAVGLRQNFFDLGGHSLLATQVIARIQEAFGVDLPLRRLFESPTVSQLANVIEQTRVEQTRVQIPRVTATRRGTESVDSLLAKLNQLSEADVRRLLDERSISNTKS